MELGRGTSGISRGSAPQRTLSCAGAKAVTNHHPYAPQRGNGALRPVDSGISIDCPPQRLTIGAGAHDLWKFQSYRAPAPQGWRWGVDFLGIPERTRLSAVSLALGRCVSGNSRDFAPQLRNFSAGARTLRDSQKRGPMEGKTEPQRGYLWAGAPVFSYTTRPLPPSLSNCSAFPIHHRTPALQPQKYPILPRKPRLQKRRLRKKTKKKKSPAIPARRRSDFPRARLASTSTSPLPSCTTTNPQIHYSILSLGE